ncbi:MFS transporter [Mucilaginibacter sp.]
MATLSETFRSLRYPNFRLYFVGQSLSLIGTWMERIAVNWLVYSLTHSALMLGIVNLAGQLPTLLLSPYGGAISDRHNRYRVLLTTQIGAMVQASIMAALILTHTYHLITIIILSAILGVVNAFDTPARQSLMIQLIDDKKDLQNAIALNSSMVNLARLLGPAVAGVLLTTVGSGACFLLNAISFVAVIISLLLMRLKPVEVKKTTQTVWQNLQQGWDYLKHEKNIQLMILLMACSSFFVMSYSTLMPVFAKDIFKGSAGTYSLLNSISGLGALFGAVYMAGLNNTLHIKRVVIYSSIICGAGIAVFALCHSLWLALLFILPSGMGMMMQIAGTNTFIQTTVTDNMRGRVISYYVMAFQGMQPLGSFLAGWAAHRVGAQVTLFVQGTIGVVVAIMFGLLFQRMRNREINRNKETIPVLENSN